MEEYYLVRTSVTQPDRQGNWTAEIGTYSKDKGDKRIAVWLGHGPLTESDLENMTIVWQTLMAVRLNVQLGLDLGLLS